LARFTAAMKVDEPCSIMCNFRFDEV